MSCHKRSCTIFDLDRVILCWITLLSKILTNFLKKSASRPNLEMQYVLAILLNTMSFIRYRPWFFIFEHIILCGRALPHRILQNQKISAFYIKSGNTGRFSLIFECSVTDNYNYEIVSTTFEPVYGILWTCKFNWKVHTPQSFKKISFLDQI